jgi:hypothetical protein
MTEASEKTRCAPCGLHGFYVLSPLRMVAYGRNGIYAQPLTACGSVPDTGVFSFPKADDVLQAAISLRVCAACGASQLFTDLEGVRAMHEADEPGVRFEPPEASEPYR